MKRKFESNKRIGKISVFMVVGLFLALSLTSPVSAIVYHGEDNTYVIVNDPPPGGNGIITWEEDGIERMRLTGGHLGIGTTTPQSKLSVAGGATIGTTWAASVFASSGDLLVENNVGIGVPDPAEKLEIDGNILFNIGGDRSISVELPIANHDGDKLTVSSGDARYLSGPLGYTGGDLVLHAGNGAGVTNPRGGDAYLYGGAPGGDGLPGDVILAHTGIVGHGKVGIGTTSPLATLHVEGTIRVDNRIMADSSDGLRLANDGMATVMTIQDNGNVGIGTFTADTLLGLKREGTVQSNIDLLSLENSGTALDNDETETSILFKQWYARFPEGWPAGVDDAGRITVGIEPGHDWYDVAITRDSYMAFQTSLDGTVDEKVRITSEGRVGIGTTSPTGYAVLHLREDSGDNAIAFSVGDDDADFIMGIDATDSKFKIHSGTSLATTSDFTITTDGKVGIGTSSPGRPLHIVDVMRLEPRSSAPNPASEGDIYVNSSDHHIYVYLGGVINDWVQLDN